MKSFVLFFFVSLLTLLLPPFHQSVLKFALSTASLFPDLNRLLEGNAQWAADVTERDAEFFTKSAEGQEPKILWIGCSDSRVPESLITQAKPGDIFVLRNIANQIQDTDDAAMSALIYAVEVLQVDHVIVGGHTGCGGITIAHDVVHDPESEEAAEFDAESAVGRFLDPLVSLARTIDPTGLEKDAAITSLSEANVRAQVQNISNSEVVQHAWQLAEAGERKSVFVHGWIYELETGRLRDLGVTQGPQENPITVCQQQCSGVKLF